MTFQKLLIFDLDETLVRASRKPLTDLYGFQVGPYYVYRRPYLQECIDFCRKRVACAVWTSAGARYAHEVVARIFPKDMPLEFVWSRDRCTFRRFDAFNEMELCEGAWVKNLKKVKRRGWCLSQVLMLDNTPKKLRFNYGNLVPIRDFRGDPEDVELPRFMRYLPELLEENDVRPVEKRGWYNRVTAPDGRDAVTVK
ncbi:HAD family hydrolase [Acanthopleuribacter pedis]|uniref:HAD family hydrolase n=1 Tax=Acanthopleuribacter pedis TaxID=442870 RepID=A0A8J7U5M4_9BACT|nr:HAD family hydrolase [Acanthopleuribacter pedis]MBO1320608.1 HAD family hydrolase [Acanthopleuribacter pedis]